LKTEPAGGKRREKENGIGGERKIKKGKRRKPRRKEEQ